MLAPPAALPVSAAKLQTAVTGRTCHKVMRLPSRIVSKHMHLAVVSHARCAQHTVT